jgi:hypothetical protein
MRIISIYDSSMTRAETTHLQQKKAVRRPFPVASVTIRKRARHKALAFRPQLQQNMNGNDNDSHYLNDKRLHAARVDGLLRKVNQ